MAIMIPEIPRRFEPASQEGIMFNALSTLPDEYFVFHSFRITSIVNNRFNESETDFIVFNKNKGIICLEAKSGRVSYQRGMWLYGNGAKMHNGGPFNQASSNKYKLMDYISRSGMKEILSNCKFFHAVWFPSISDEILSSMVLPSEADKNLVLTTEALSDPKRFLEKIFSIELRNNVKTNIHDAEVRRLVREVLCPEFEVVPSASFDVDLKKIVFHRLLKEQSSILDFLVEQKTAAINGVAGTGKTMIALEKARRHASLGEKVLFLCFNFYLKEYLEKNYRHENITFFTIDGFACNICNSSTADFQHANSLLKDMYISGRFDWKHVIVDEGQDFGREVVEQSDILQTLCSTVSASNIDGTFYIFYDKLQMVQANVLPKFIDSMDCKLTLYKNCRNTENIAITSLKPVTTKKPIVFEGNVKGEPGNIYFCSSIDRELEQIDNVLSSLSDISNENVVILTMKTEENSVLSSRIKEGTYKGTYKFTTCRKFKGLEADAVVLVDVDRKTFEDNGIQLYYVGTSRARVKLNVIAMLNTDECKEILQKVFHVSENIYNPQKALSGELNMLGALK